MHFDLFYDVLTFLHSIDSILCERKDKNGETALDYARRSGTNITATMLVKELKFFKLEIYDWYQTIANFIP